MEKLKIYSLEEMIDKHIGKIGSKKRNSFENKLRADLLKEVKKKRLL